MNILAWNIRGINSYNKDRSIRGLIKKKKVDIVGLTDTKYINIDKFRIASLCGGRAVFGQERAEQ